MSNFYIYAHYKTDGSVFYVGKGKGKRAYEKRGRSQLWGRTVAKHGLVVEILANNLDENIAFRMEEDFIYLYGRIDLKTGCLVNMTNGGEGKSGAICSAETKAKHSNPSDETRAKKSAALKGNKCHLGKPHSKESRAKISASHTGAKRTAEHRAKNSAANKGRTFSDEHRARMSAAAKNRYLNKKKIGV